MVLISVQSVDDNNGYRFSNDFSETIHIDPKSRVSLINIQFERKADYMVLSTGNSFEVKVGSPFNSMDTLSIPPATYNASSLADAIQDAFNNRYILTGHQFSVNYDHKEVKFNISHKYASPEIPVKVAEGGDIGVGTNAPNVELTGQANNQMKWGGLTNGTAQYVLFDDTPETTYIPSSTNGGSFVENKLFFNQATYPTTPGSNTYGYLFGIYSASLDQNNPPTTGAKEIGANANLTWLDCGMVFTTNAGGNPLLKFIEMGNDIGGNLKFVPKNGDTYKIQWSNNGSDLTTQYPEYLYKRSGDSDFSKFPITGVRQISLANIMGTKYQLIVGADNKDADNNHPKTEMFYTPHGSSNILGEPLTAGNNNQRVKEHSYSKAELTRTSGGSYQDTSDTGIISQPIGADLQSRLRFKAPYSATNNSDYFVAVLDENVRRGVQTAEGDDATDMGINDPFKTTMADSSFSAEPTADQNPALVVYRFNQSNNATGGTTTNGIYRRTDMNQHYVYSPNTYRTIQQEELVNADFTWNNVASLFEIRTYARANVVELWVYADGDPTNTKATNMFQLDSVLLPLVNKTGWKTGNITNAGTGYTETEGAVPNKCAVRLRKPTGEDTKALVLCDLAGGNLSNPVIVNPGTGLDLVLSYHMVEQAGTGGDKAGGSTDGRMTITALTDYSHIDNMGTKYLQAKTHQGYSYWLAVGSANVNTDPLTDVALLIEDESNTHNEYFQFRPNVEPKFGELIGFRKADYYQSHPTPLESDAPPNPDHQGQLADNLMINVGNLPIKSYVGKRFKSDAVLNDKPIGSQQCITRLVGQVPRNYDGTLGGNSAIQGPFYYDYFPYSVPLHNANEMLINELDISITNPDGTDATDIIKSNLLLNISNVKSVGEGGNEGYIARPVEQRLNPVELNIGKNQLEPSLRGNFAGGDEPLEATKTEDPWGHGELGANKSLAL